MIASAKDNREDPIQVAQRLVETIPTVMAGLRAEMRRHGVDHHTHFRVLMKLSSGPVSTGELACAFEVSAPTMTRTIDVLEERGWVERRADERDRRRVMVHLTQGGGEELRRNRQESVRYLAGLLQCASDDELEALASGLTVLRDVIQRNRDEHRQGGESECLDQHRKG